MTTHNDTNVKIIENATRDDVRPGDHVVWERSVGERSVAERDVTTTLRREGIAHHRDHYGDWCTKGGMWLTDLASEDATLTIRRPAQELPPERDGVVLVPADLHESITTTDGQEFSRLTFTTKKSIWYGPNLAARLGDLVIQTTSRSRLIPGTWKADDQ